MKYLKLQRFSTKKPPFNVFQPPSVQFPPPLLNNPGYAAGWYAFGGRIDEEQNI